MWLLKAFLQKAQLSDGNRKESALCTQPVVLGEYTVAHGSMTNELHILLLCTSFMLEFKQGEKGSR